MTQDAVWVDILPSMSKFADELAKGADGAAEKVGEGAGKKFGLALLGGLGVVAGGAVVAGKALYDIGATFDDMADTIRVGTGATGDALDGLVASAKTVGQSVPASFGDIGAAVADVNTRLGLTGPTLEKMAAQVLQAGNLMGEAIDVNKMSASFSAFQISGDATTDAMDHLFRVSQATGVGMNQLAQNVATAAPAMQGLGFSFEETAALMGGFDKAGLNSGRMVAGMSKALVTLAKDGEEPAKAFERVTGELFHLIEKGDEAAALDLAGSLFGTRGAPQFIAAVKEGTISSDELMTTIGATEDTILGAAEDTADFAEAWDVFKNQVLLVIEPIATRVFNAMGDGMRALSEHAIPAFQGLIEQWEKGEGAGGALRAAVEAIATPVENLIGFVRDDLTPSLQGFGEWVSENEGTIKAWGASLGIVAGAMGAVALQQKIMAAGGLLSWIAQIVKSTTLWTAATQAQELATKLLNIAQRANPIGIIVTLLAALVAGLVVAYNESEEFRAIVDGVGAAIREGIGKALEWLGEKFTWLGEEAGKLADGIGKWFGGMKDDAVKKATDLRDGVTNGFTQANTWAIEKATGLATGVQTKMEDARRWAIEKATGLASGVQTHFENARSWAVEKATALGDRVMGAFDNLKQNVERWGQLFGQLISGDFEGARKTAEQIMGQMRDSLLGVFNGIIDGGKRIFNLLPDQLKEPIRTAVRWINDTFVGGLNKLFAGINLSFRIPAIPGFADGGYTGPGRKYDPAGVVHAGEVVWSQDDVRAWGGPSAVDALRRARGLDARDIPGYAGGGIVANATQGFRGYDPAALAQMRAWAAATGRTWYMTGLGGARSYAQQWGLYLRYLAGGNLAADPRKGRGPHMEPAIAMDINPHPSGAAKALLGQYGLGLTVPGEPWHIARLGGRSGGAATGGGFDFGIGALISKLLDALPIGAPWGDVVKESLKKVPDALIKTVMGIFTGGYADGTDYAQAGIRAVAERGPELVTRAGLYDFRGGERVFSTDETRRMLDRGSIQMPRELVVVDVDGVLIGRMRVEARGAVIETARTGMRL